MPYPDRLRHAQVGERVDDRRPDVGFVDLPFKGSGVQAVAQLLEPVHHVLGNAAPVVAAIVLPAVEPLGLDFLDDTLLATSRILNSVHLLPTTNAPAIARYGH